MSETIQSISQGTYTIGNTSATNFIAGPGITIDSPSAGTVRIANDETVLWENLSNTTQLYSGTTTFTLSESYLNFEKVKVYYRHSFSGNIMDTSEGIVIPDSNMNLGVGAASQGDNNWTLIDRAIFVFNKNSNTICSVGATTRAGIQINGTTISVNTANAGIIPIRIVGINRISGANET